MIGTHDYSMRICKKADENISEKGECIGLGGVNERFASWVKYPYFI